MPSTVAVLTNLTYAATDLQNFPRIFLEIIEGGPDELADLSGRDDPLLGTDGMWFRPRRRRRLPILLEGWVAGAGANEAAQRSDTADARQELLALFDPTAARGVLSVDTEDGTTWTIPAQPEMVVPDRRPVVPARWGYSIRLVAVDPPYWTAGS